MTFPRPSEAVVHRLAAKGRREGEHGLPKPEIPVAELSFDGVRGDYNVYRQEEKRGDPAMALLVLPLETIEELNRDGWPVRPGDLGENITTRGVPYDRLEPPARFSLGSARVETTKACTPCTNLYLLPYVGRERGPKFLRATLGRRGWYARVLTPGTVRTGDPLALEPAPAR